MNGRKNKKQATTRQKPVKSFSSSVFYKIHILISYALNFQTTMDLLKSSDTGGNF